MAEIPKKIYFNRTLRIMQDSAGSQISKQSLFPFATIGQKFWMNMQVVTDASGTKFTEYESGTGAIILVDNDYSNNAPIVPLKGGNTNWTAGTGSEYYYAETSDISAKPSTVYENVGLSQTEMTEGTVGALSAGEWGWDTDTLYVRLTDSTDPDSKASGYVGFKPTVTATNPFINVDQATFNQANSWYDEDTASFRDPVIANGEMSFYVNANTVDFYNRLGTEDEVINTTMQIQLLRPTTAEYFERLELLYFICKNRYFGGDYSLELTVTNYYSKAEINAIVAGLASLISNSQVSLADNSTINIELGAQGTYRRFVIDVSIDDGTNYKTLIISVKHNGTTAYLSFVHEDNDDYTGLTLDADLSGGSVRLNITATAHGAESKVVYGIIKQTAVST